MNERGTGSQVGIGWWLAGMILAGVVLFWLLWGSDEEGVPQEPPREAPQMETAPDEEEIEPDDDGPLHRPPGTAPADPRRPATVPYEQGGGESGANPGGDESGEESELGSSVDTEPSNLGNGSRSTVRSVPSHLQGSTDDVDEDRASEKSDPAGKFRNRHRDRQDGPTEGEASDQELAFEEPNDEEGDGSRGDWDRESEEWIEEHGELPEGEWGEEVGRYEDGEWVDAGVAEKIEDDEWSDERDEQLAQDEIEQGRDIDEPSGPQDVQPPAGSDDIVSSYAPESGHLEPGTAEEFMGESGEAPPSQEALDGYQDELDRAGIPGAEDASLYAAVATNGLADALYVLSAGRTLSDSEASRQRDDIIAGADDGLIDFDGEPDDELSPEEEAEPTSDDNSVVGGEKAEEDEEPFVYDEEWTVWLDAADWLRYIQQEEYPSLTVLVDDVEEAATRLDPEIPKSEQVDELREFFEAIEVVLEAMAAEDRARAQVAS